MMDKFMRALHKLHKGERGLTGLETAIILIAFVTVAAVFGYAVLSAGIFSTEKAKESIYEGMAEAKSTMVIKGNIVAAKDLTPDAYTGVGNYTYTSGNYIGEIRVTLANNMGGEPIDLRLPSDTSNDGIVDEGENNARTIVSYADKNVHIPSVAWGTRWLGEHDSDNVLERGETVVFLIPVGMALHTNGQILAANNKFSLEIKPPHGATVAIEKWIPPDVESVMDLK